MVAGRADSLARGGGELKYRLVTHIGELLHTAPHKLAGLLVKRLDLIAFFDINNLRLVVLIGAVSAPSPAAKARIACHALGRGADDEGGAHDAVGVNGEQSPRGGGADADIAICSHPEQARRYIRRCC